MSEQVQQPMRTYRFLITEGNPPEDDAPPEPREVFLSLPERDDLDDGITVDLLKKVGGALKSWYGFHGFCDPVIHAGGPVDFNAGGGSE